MQSISFKKHNTPLYTKKFPEKFWGIRSIYIYYPPYILKKFPEKFYEYRSIYNKIIYYEK